ncbi:FAD binding domain-containing protein [Podospora fimiseda]|uniref:FAD binding domain-containing protein n=1 Tax=Podospora fimiseda TaxID=252190 RepID=A0AAN7BFV3_9PEZI|nr:FAD binding domain-containing protein [Podospora fimiseda]
MRTNFSFSALFCALTSIASAAVFNMENDATPQILPRQNDFVTFAKSIQVPEDQIKSLSTSFSSAKTTSAILNVACLTAKILLGEPQVDTTPLNQAVVQENWSQSCVAQPYCIIQPRNAQDVSLAIRVISFFKIKFSVRSGGHSPNPGFSSIDNQGILINLSRLNSVTLSSDKTVASVGPGARWGQVFSALDPSEATVIGGRVPTVGVSGLILGGGYFHSSERHGLAADNVKNFEVVKSDGEIINANSQQNSDLFWALKGGGPNFGIVTKFDLYTIPTYLVWGTIKVYSVEKANEVIAAFDKWQLNGAKDVKSSAGLIIGLDSITLFLSYNEPVTAPPQAVFAPFDSVTPLAVALPPTNLTWNVVNQVVASTISSAPARHDYRGFSSRVDTSLTKEMYSVWRGKAIAARGAFGVNQTFVLQHVGDGLRQAGIAKGGNPLNIPAGPQQWWTTLIDWTEARFDANARHVSIETTTRWAQRAKERGVEVSFLYLNDASRDQNPLVSYGASNLARLKSIAAKYDTGQVFQKLQNGGFLLSKA